MTAPSKNTGSRREFLTALSAVGVAAVPRRRPAAPRVEALPTVFFGHPDGESTLVRFLAHDLDAPGARLRVYDGRRQLLGTAAMLRRADVLFGELWLPADHEIRLATTLEAPGLGRVVYGNHRVTPGRRWTMHLAVLVDPDALIGELESLPPVPRAVRASLYHHYQAAGDPLAGAGSAVFADHLSLLRMTESAGELERRFGIPMSGVACIGERPLPSTAPLALANTGVRVLAAERADGSPFQWWRSPENGQLIVTMPAGGTAAELGFLASAAEMARRVERWLSEARFLSPAYGPALVLIVHRESGERLSHLDTAVREWNARYAYPQLTVGQLDGLRAEVANEYGHLIPVAHSVPAVAAQPAPAADATDTLAAHEVAVTTRAQELIATLASALPTEGADLAAVGAHIDAAVPGTVVFNPSPFPRTDLVMLADGSEQIVTDVPELGYAYFPRRQGVSWTDEGPGFEVGGRHNRVVLDPGTGAIRSLRDAASGIEMVRAGSPGLNVVDGSRLIHARRVVLPRIAHRVIATRQLPSGATIETTVTVYEHLPWVDVENHVADPGSGLVYDFSFAVDNARLGWEIPAGHEERDVPVSSLSHLRWLRLAGIGHAILFRGRDAPQASVDANARLRSTTPRGRSRYRLAIEPPSAGPTAAWRFGWHTEPLLTAAVSGSGGGESRLPRFGSLFVIDRVGVATLAIKRAADRRGVIVYLQELLGLARSIGIRPGLLRFGGVESVDFLERNTFEEIEREGSSVRVFLPAWGVASVRLLDVQLVGA